MSLYSNRNLTQRSGWVYANDVGLAPLLVSHFLGRRSRLKGIGKAWRDVIGWVEVWIGDDRSAWSDADHFGDAKAPTLPQLPTKKKRHSNDLGVPESWQLCR
jgi:hypothetical protein